VHKDFILSESIESNSFFIRDLALSKLLLLNDSNYPWLLLVPRKANQTEIFDLSIDDQHQLIEEIVLVSSKLKVFTNATKINVASLGNKTSQLHIHVIARTNTDIAWPSAVWDYAVATKYSPETAKKFILEFSQLLDFSTKT
jgi:diadenosine tetraphosphate (Ap4A) HIT family hydrolase